MGAQLGDKATVSTNENSSSTLEVGLSGAAPSASFWAEVSACQGTNTTRVGACQPGT